MKFKIAIILSVLISFSSVAQSSLNKLDANGKRTGVWKKYYPNKRVRYTGQFLAGKEVGVFKYYSINSSKHPIAIKTFKENSSIATVKFFTEKGILKSEGQMDGKVRTGKWVYYQADGKSLLSFESYKNGLLNGESITYYPNGKTAEIVHYKNKKLHGSVKRFTKKGTVLDDVNYVEGKLNGYAKFYNEKGDLIYEGTYENDEKLDDWFFYIDGEPSKKGNQGQ
ncbi:Antitoxin component YwqK of the YwqJK toxin-antitoxin module [Lutibacter oricola]|uniref:Antitoxin component YwqK of the YwqJK toxin-antitoxin module n=1 Tax=Lutibacter oricola TaxID=762486 RepID=A0A1H3EZ11_9FLAO|nr:hypothetical protein [Lutibacter oricola]SDX83179.1 Antitoxin component YwqK of the YwqJK toxin-antitoxin module [Lutibacter oricola]